ncbi:MAG: hypothetical protein K6F75_11950 [Butyrivibrio sp.]|nr:hypothetical protein [Butyrivibrio sp.]
MTAFFYPEQTICSNVTYGLLSTAVFANRKSLRDLSGHTVIIVTDELVDDTLSRAVADLILRRGCKNIAFCGESSEEMQEIFDQEDREINGFNDVTGYEDFAITRRFEDIQDLSEEISMCWGDVLVLCSNMGLLRECQRVINEEIAIY